jgi:hypothetical protein
LGEDLAGASPPARRDEFGKKKFIAMVVNSRFSMKSVDVASIIVADSFPAHGN